MKITNNGFLLNDDLGNIRVFLPSKDISIFPCSRRGRAATGIVYDPEARLNTERTNRIHTAVNGFKDSFIESCIKNTDQLTYNLVFVLAGYRVEVKEFNPVAIASMLSSSDRLYAFLRLHTEVSLGVSDYYTEVLFRQSASDEAADYLDVPYGEEENEDDFFVGVSFVKDITNIADDERSTAHSLLLFSKFSDSWEPEQTSLLPKIEHDTTPDSIKISGDFTIEYTKANNAKQVSFKAAEDGVVIGSAEIAELTVKDSAFIEGTATIYGDTSADDIYAKNLTIADTNGEVDTPQLRVNRITSDSGTITIDGKKLALNKSLEMLAKATATEPAKATIEQAEIGSLIVKSDSKLKQSDGKIKATTEVDTPTLKTNTIMSDSTEIAVDTNLKLGNNTSITTPVANVHSKLNVTNSDKTATAVINVLEVDKITQNSKTVPAISLIQSDATINTYQLQITIDASKN